MGVRLSRSSQANVNCRNRQVTIAIVLVLLVIGNIVLSIVAVRRNLPRGSFIVCDGVRLHYIDRGDPAAPFAAVRRELVAVAALRSGDWPGLPESFDTEDQNCIRPEPSMRKPSAGDPLLHQLAPISDGLRNNKASRIGDRVILAGVPSDASVPQKLQNPLDEDILAVVRALAKLRARIDHDAEIARRSVQARATEPSA
jgi:hypothetical protein